MTNHRKTSSSARRGCLSLFSFRFLLVSLLWTTAPLAFAQSSTISGHVVDGSGTPVQNVEVTVSSDSTHQKTVVKSNASGYFLLPPLPPGTYSLDATTATFATIRMKGIKLEVGGEQSINLTLQPMTQAQEVTVEATPPELQTTTSERGNVIESQFVENTPLNIRNPLQLVNFAQGVTAYSSESGNNDQSQAYTNTFRINGGKLATTESLLDGGANTTLYDYNAVAAVPQVDSIQEFKVLTTAYEPEWGRTSGGVVTFATKAGTDHLHGSVFEYIRNSDTDANSFTADESHTPKPHFERNQFGFALGGPVAFPPHVRHGEHRTFFYVTYEGLRQTTANTFLYTVPTALERKGDFSQSRDANGNLIVIYDPSTTTLQPVGSTACTSTPVTTGQTVYCRSPFAGNKIPTLDAAGMAILNSYPMPNRLGTGDSSVNNFFSASPSGSTQNTVNFRVDHRFSDRQSIFAHFDWFQRHNTNGDPYGNGLSPTANPQRLPGYNIMLNHTWTLSPSLVFQHFFVYAHQESNRIPNTLGYNPTQLGFNSNVTQGLSSTTFPAITSASRLSAIGPQSGLEADAGTTLQYAASMVYLKGKHDFKFGMDFRYLALQLHINQLVSLTANSNFTGGPNVGTLSSEPDSGSGIADLLLGTGTVTSGILPAYHITHPYFASYAQDEYHITPKLTLNYGVRYNLESPDKEDNNEYQFLDLTTKSPLNSQVTSLGTLTGGPGFVGANGVGPRVQNTQFLNFEPRVGVAYSLDNKTVVRAGYGIFHAPAWVNLGNPLSQGYSATTTSNPAQANGVTPLYNMDNPFPSGLTPVSGNSLGLSTNAGLAIAGYARQQHVSYSNQWSLDVQRELPYNFVVKLGYVGNTGVHLYVPINYNQLPDSDLAQGSALTATVSNPFYGVITNKTSPLAASTVRAFQLQLPHPQFQTMTAYGTGAGHSGYNALQLSVERRFSQGLALLFNYTHSKMLDNVGDYFLSGGFQDNYCPSCDRSISQQDLPDVIRLSVQYELPFGKGKPFANHGPLAQVVGGWLVGTFYTYDDGSPVQLTSPTNSTNSTNVFGGGTTIRPNVTGVSTAVPGGRHIAIGQGANVVSEYFNPAAFSATPAFTFGNARRYQETIRLPGTQNFDMLAEKRFALPENIGMTFRFEAFNAFNRVQFTGLSTSYSSTPDTFGYILPSQANSPRSLQASLRLSF
jgi:hypothetical protein